MSESQERSRLPFEPAKRRKKKAKDASSSSEAKPKSKQSPKQNRDAAAAPTRKEKTPAKTAEKTAARSPAPAAIPKTIARRMAARTLVLCGIPTFLGFATFVVSYIIIRKDLFPLPNTAVLLVSLAFFGLGVFGLSYGIFSASWDESEPGSLLGIGEASKNFSRTIGSWRAAREAAKNRQKS